MKNCCLFLGVFAFCLVNQVLSAPTDAPDLATALPWLKDILNDDDILTLPSGQYKLGSHHTVSENPRCSNTPLIIAVGECTLLKNCPNMFHKLKNVDDYVESFCLLENGYAGTCCPMTIELYTGKLIFDR